MDSKYCSKCEQTKSLTEFNKNRNKPDGAQAYCRECTKRINNDLYRNGDRKRQVRERRDREVIANRSFTQRYKRMRRCHFCNESEPVALDLHHLNPSEKDFNPSQMYSHSRKQLKKEIRKCIVLCSNCHRKVHAGLLGITLPSSRG